MAQTYAKRVVGRVVSRRDIASATPSIQATYRFAVDTVDADRREGPVQISRVPPGWSEQMLVLCVTTPTAAATSAASRPPITPGVLGCECQDKQVCGEPHLTPQIRVSQAVVTRRLTGADCPDDLSEPRGSGGWLSVL